MLRNLLRDIHPFPARCVLREPRARFNPSFLPSFSSSSFCPTSSSSSSTTTTTSLPHPCTRSHRRDVDAQCHLLLCPCSRLSSFSIARIFPRNYPFLIFSHSISFLFSLSRSLSFLNSLILVSSISLFPSRSPSLSRGWPTRLIRRARFRL